MTKEITEAIMHLIKVLRHVKSLAPRQPTAGDIDAVMSLIRVAELRVEDAFRWAGASMVRTISQIINEETP